MLSATVTFPDGTSYLNGDKNNYKIITVQDTSIIINSKNNVTADTAVSDSTYDPHRSVSIILGAVANNAVYTVDITIGGSKQTATFTATSRLHQTDVLNDLKTDIEAMTGAHAGITVSKFANELELQHTADMDVHAEGGINKHCIL